MLGYLGRAVPLDDLAKNGGAEEDRLFAERVMDIRRFAAEELGLRESANYTRYVELDRDYLAAVVSAAANDSFTRHEWWFPVVGKVPYKGFFNVEDARKERAKLEKKGLDVWIRGVDAFSTLGWFKDPLYSYMKSYSIFELADLLIHELLHATVYLKNHSQFNEGLAEFVGREGARLYLDSISADAEDNQAAREDYAAFLSHIRGLINELGAVYDNPDISHTDKLTLKEQIIAASQENFSQTYDDIFTTENFRGFQTLPVNNAYLDLYRIYYEEDTWFKDLYEKSGSDLRAYISAAKTLKNRGDPFSALENALRGSI